MTTPPIITVYSKSHCQQCEMTKRWLKQHDLAFEEVDLEVDIEPGGPGTNLDAAKALGYASAPIVLVSMDGIPGNETHWSGFNPIRLNAIIEGAAA